MMVDHSSVKIFSGSAWTMFCMNDLFYFIMTFMKLCLNYVSHLNIFYVSHLNISIFHIFVSCIFSFHIRSLTPSPFKCSIAYKSLIYYVI